MSARPALQVTLSQTAPIPLAAEFSCAAGELLALVGPSGSGKSTILRAIAGTYSPTGGRVVVNGSTWLDASSGTDLPPYRRRAGLVFQSYALFPHMTALGNVVAALGHLPRAARGARARALLQRVNLAGLEDRRPAALSGGQQQRVAVARALARDPDVLLLDEPFAAVDRATRQRLYREIVELRRSLAIPAVLVTHDLEEAQMLADRMAVLHHGRTLQTGPPAEITTRPVSTDVARLVGLGNIFEGRVAGHAPDGSCTRLAWAGHLLEAAPRPDLSVGAQVSWVIPDGFVVLHRRDRPSRGERENPVTGTVEQFIVLGQNASVALRPHCAPDRPIRFTLPLHVARRNGLAEGVEARVSLLASGIHLMEGVG